MRANIHLRLNCGLPGRLRREACSIVCLAMIALLLAGCTGSLDGTPTLSGHMLIVGSTALQPLASRTATLFQRQYPQVHIEVRGGGSLFGLGAVTSHRADIGDSDIYADPAIYPAPDLTDHIVCIIPFAMIVNPDVTIHSLTQQQIIDIFSTGKIRNWSQVGGPNLAVVPVVRPQTSGTRDTFRKYILNGRDENGRLLKTDSSVTVRDTVAHTPGAIGYLALSVLTPQVQALAIDGQAPTAQNILAGRYIFWSFEHMYTLGNSNAALSAYLNFMLTVPLQHEAESMGYIPITSVKLSGTTSTTVYSMTTNNAPRVDKGEVYDAHL